MDSDACMVSRNKRLLRRNRIMKRFVSIVLAISMLCSLVVPAMAVEESTNNGEELWWVEEGEIWHPAEGVMAVEDDGCPNSHFAPSGFTYKGYTEGNTFWEGRFVDAGLYLLAAFTGGGIGLGTVATIISWTNGAESFRNFLEEGVLRTTYHKHIYTNGNRYWYHYIWYYVDDNYNGYLRFVACETQTNY